MSVPSAKLRIECQMTNPPTPISVHVIVKDRLVAIAGLDVLRSAIKELEQLEAARAVER